MSVQFTECVEGSIQVAGVKHSQCELVNPKVAVISYPSRGDIQNKPMKLTRLSLSLFLFLLF